MRMLGTVLAWLIAVVCQAASPEGARSSGSVFILTTPEGADLPAGTELRDFPVLVRLHADSFDFDQAAADGRDLRFATTGGMPLPHRIEAWDAVAGTAAVWVRVPVIRGNETQELKLSWGHGDEAPEPEKAAVFDAANGYVAVWHTGGPVRDEVGTLVSQDTGTQEARGVIGFARRFPGAVGVFCGDAITHLPAGNGPHTTEAWFRADKPNATVVGWGNEQGQGKVVMQYRSPPHMRMDCYFSGGDVASRSRLQTGEWTHVVHTFQPGESRIYVNGRLDGVAERQGSSMAIKNPARLWLGGWYGNYDFQGDIDEVRISSVVRSPEWVRLEYENQKPLQTLVGPVVRPGSTFAVSVATLDLGEGEQATVSAEAGGARKVRWILVRDGHSEVVAVDRFTHTFAAGRVTGDTRAVLRIEAVYADGVRMKEIPITIRETIPDPEFTLTGPGHWDGREPIHVVSRLTNEAALEARGAGHVTVEWQAGPFAVVTEAAPATLRLTHAQNSGRLTVSATMHNGGAAVTRSMEIAVTEPEADAFVDRPPDPDEKPREGQFYARDDHDRGTLHYNGRLDEPADAVFLRLYADDTLVATETARPAPDRSYALTTRLTPGLTIYRIEFGTTTDGRETVLHRVGDIVCGDAYLIDGQSNALATDTGETAPPETSPWIRSYGAPPRNRTEKGENLWCRPVWRARAGEKAELGWWGMELAKRLVESRRLPVCIINGAVGGTRIDQHQRNETDPTDLTTIYGRMLWRVREARLTHGIRAIIWHQGENDQGADGPAGGYGWETYQRLFVQMAGGWKRDFPNVRHYYVFQIWPNACAMGGREGAGDRLRERQRTLPRLFSRMSILSTLGIRPPGGCHYPLEGWSEFARLLQPLIERDHHGHMPAAPLTAPNLVHATRQGVDTIVLRFDQPVRWDDALVGQFYLDGEKDRVASGSVVGQVLTLRLKEPASCKTITYLKEVSWSQDTLLEGVNGIAALTFCEVPIDEDDSPVRSRPTPSAP